MYIWRRTLTVTIDAKKWLEVSKTWGLRYQIVLEFMLGIPHLWKHMTHLSDSPVNSSVLYALCILPFSNSIEFACPVEYEWTWICHIEAKTLKVIVHSNQLSCFSAMRIRCLKLKQLQKAWSRMKKRGPCMKKSEVDPKLIHSL